MLITRNRECANRRGPRSPFTSHRRHGRTHNHSALFTFTTDDAPAIGSGHSLYTMARCLPASRRGEVQMMSNSMKAYEAARSTVMKKVQSSIESLVVDQSVVSVVGVSRPSFPSSLRLGSQEGRRLDSLCDPLSTRSTSQNWDQWYIPVNFWISFAVDGKPSIDLFVFRLTRECSLASAVRRWLFWTRAMLLALL